VTDLRFAVAGVHAEGEAAVPTLNFRLRIASSVPVHALLLRCLLQIEPRRRPHTPSEQERLQDLFGEAPRWKDTLRPVIWSRVSLTTPGFEESTEIDLPVACTYDFEVTAAKYLDALEGGELPLLFLFSGTVFTKAPNGFQIEQVPWDREAAYRMPVQIWRDLMEAHFPQCAWIRLRRESLDALQRFKVQHGFLNWDEVIHALVQQREAVAG
jgi:hypothetical protein